MDTFIKGNKPRGRRSHYITSPVALHEFMLVAVPESYGMEFVASAREREPKTTKDAQRQTVEIRNEIKNG